MKARNGCVQLGHLRCDSWCECVFVFVFVCNCLDVLWSTSWMANETSTCLRLSFTRFFGRPWSGCANEINKLKFEECANSKWKAAAGTLITSVQSSQNQVRPPDSEANCGRLAKPIGRPHSNLPLCLFALWCYSNDEKLDEPSNDRTYTAWTSAVRRFTIRHTIHAAIRLNVTGRVWFDDRGWRVIAAITNMPSQLLVRLDSWLLWSKVNLRHDIAQQWHQQQCSLPT